MLYRNNLADMQDPTGISGYIHACRTETMYEDARSKVLTASARADKALDAYKEDEFKDAFGWWDLLWDGKFPSYYK